MLAPGAKPGGGWQPPVEGPDRHMVTCGALRAPRHQANTESIASLKTEENESAIPTPGRDECLDPKRSAHNSAQKGHTAQWRYGQQAFQIGNHIGQGGHEGNQESVSGQHCLQTHNRSKVEPSPSLRDPGGEGGSTPCGSVYTSGHMRITGASSRDGAGMGQVWRNATEQGLTAASISSHTS